MRKENKSAAYVMLWVGGGRVRPEAYALDITYTRASTLLRDGWGDGFEKSDRRLESADLLTGLSCAKDAESQRRSEKGACW